MLVPGVLLTSALDLGAAILFLAVAWHLRRRRVDASMRWAWSGFVASWGALAFMAAADGTRGLIALTAEPSLPLYEALLVGKIFAAALVTLGFGAYVAALWTARYRAFAVALAAYATTHAMPFVVLVQAARTVGIEMGAWVTRPLVVDRVVPSLAVEVVVVILFFLPPVALASAYLMLLGRVEDPLRRFRIAAVAASVAGFHLADFAQSTALVSADNPVTALGSALILASAALALVAYRTPAFVLRRLSPAASPTAGPWAPLADRDA